MELNLAREYRRGDRTFGPGRVNIEDAQVAAQIARTADRAGDLLPLEGPAEAALEAVALAPEILPHEDPEPEVASAPPAVEAVKAEKPPRP